MEPEAGDLGLEVLATAAPDEGHPREAFSPEGAPTGACHKCGAKIKDNARMRLCIACGCRYVGRCDVVTRTQPDTQSQLPHLRLRRAPQHSGGGPCGRGRLPSGEHTASCVATGIPA